MSADLMAPERFGRGNWWLNANEPAPPQTYLGHNLGTVVSRVTTGPTGKGATYERLRATGTGEGRTSAYAAMPGRRPRRVRVGNALTAYPDPIGEETDSAQALEMRPFTDPIAPGERDGSLPSMGPRFAMGGRRLPHYAVVRRG